MYIWLVLYFIAGAALGRLLDIYARRYCGIAENSSYLPAMFITGFAFMLSGLHFMPGLPLALIFVLTGCLVLISLIDCRVQIIPDWLVMVIAAAGLLHTLLVEPDALFDALSGGMLAFVIMLVIFVISRGGMGGGDVKLSAAVGLWLGVEGSLLFLLLAFVMGGIISLLLLAAGVKNRNDAVPFGPFLCVSAFITVLYAPLLLNYYWSLFLL
ncbi:MAG: prepilin peptidase [Phascolarctobacterium sp.]|nr:MAG: prepilin peptidase [Phascolarctobacterium sp.]